MNSFAQLIKNRRSIRRFTGEPLLPDQAERIMKAALMAPSSKNCKPWYFVLIENKDTLQALAHSRAAGAAHIGNAALAVAVLTDPLRSTAYIEDASIAATYIQLQAEDLGLGSCWVQISGRELADGYSSEQYVRDLLDIPLQLAVQCIVAIGHKEQALEPHNEDELLWERLHIEKFRYDPAE